MNFNIVKNKKGSTIFLLTFLVLCTILTITLAASNIVAKNISMNRNQYESAKAYFAAESGVERLLWEYLKLGSTFNPESNCDATNNNLNFSVASVTCDNTEHFYTISENSASYRVVFQSNSPLTFYGYGTSTDVQRRIELTF